MNRAPAASGDDLLPATVSALAPGPAGSFWSGSLAAFRGNPLQFLAEAAGRYGDVVRFQIGPRGLRRLFHLVNHPDLVKHVLVDRHRDYAKSIGYRKLRAMLGDGLLTADGTSWLFQRRVAQPVFQPQQLAGLVEVMSDATERMLLRWRNERSPDQPINIAVEMSRLALEIAGRALFGVDVGDDAEAISNAVTLAGEHVHRRIRSAVSVPSWIPTPANVRFRDAVDTLDGIVERIVKGRNQSRNDANLLSMLAVETDVETGQRLTPTQLHDAVKTFLIAGHETTAYALSWTWYLLASHAEIARAARDEACRIAGDRPVRFDDMEKLAMVRQIAHESLRLYPPAYLFAREPRIDDEIDGYRIPAKSIVLICPYLLHRHRDCWENPDCFDPRRFEPDRGPQRSSYAYVPFGAGPRQCIGNHFAMLELQVVLASVLRAYRIEPIADEPVGISARITLRPERPLWMRPRAWSQE